MEQYWWILDEWGCLNFFDTVEAYQHARRHVHGLMRGDTVHVGTFHAKGVDDCWKMEDLLNWEDGYQKGDVI